MRETDGDRLAAAGGSCAARSLGAIAVAFLMVVTAAACQRDAKSFPGALPGTQTDVSSAEAFQHFGLVIPPSASKLRYQAVSSDGGGAPGTSSYSLGAVLETDCQDVPTFVSRSSLQLVPSDLALPNAGLDAWSGRHGWTASADDTWYMRKFATYQTIEVLVQQAAGACMVYLTA